jgi:hypothetical protein
MFILEWLVTMATHHMHWYDSVHFGNAGVAFGSCGIETVGAPGLYCS